MNNIKKIVTISIINFLLITSLVVVAGSAKGIRAEDNSGMNQELYAIDATTAPLDSAQSTEPINTPVSTDSPLPVNTLAPIKKPVSTPKPAAPKPPSNRCIIVIQGVKYDITDFRKMHSGGDIFKCGTDMTNVFFGQHNNSTLSAMAKYKI